MPQSRFLAAKGVSPLPTTALTFYETKAQGFSFLLELQAFFIANASKPLPRSKGALSFAHDSLTFYLRLVNIFACDSPTFYRR